MLKLNINKVPDSKVNHLISKDYGGRHSMKEIFKKRGIGIAHLMYHAGDAELDRHHSEMHRLKVNMELYKNGLGIFFRNMDSNFLYLFHFQEIQSIEIYKEPDIITPRKNSIYSLLKNAGRNHIKLRAMLMEDEIIELNPLLIQLKLNDNGCILLEGKTGKYEKISGFFEKVDGLYIQKNLKQEIMV